MPACSGAGASNAMNQIFSTLFSMITQPVTNWMKVEILKSAIAASKGARALVLLCSLLFIMVIISIGGFVGIHIAVFYLLPFSKLTKAWILLGLSVFYVGLALTAIVVLTARKRWNRLTGLDALAARFSKNIQKD